MHNIKCKRQISYRNLNSQWLTKEHVKYSEVQLGRWNLLCGRPIAYRPHYASCPSVRPSVRLRVRPCLQDYMLSRVKNAGWLNKHVHAILAVYELVDDVLSACRPTAGDRAMTLISSDNTCRPATSI